MIDLSEALMNQNVKKAYDVSFEGDTFSYQMGEYPIKSCSNCHLEIVSPKKNTISLLGSFSIQLQIPCDRCLQDVTCDMNIELARDFIIGELEEEDEETEVLSGAMLDEQNLMFSEILINLPAKVLCQSDCKGICLVCGKNLNQGECGCDRVVKDPRMAAVLDVFHNFDKTNN